MKQVFLVKPILANELQLVASVQDHFAVTYKLWWWQSTQKQRFKN